MVRMMALELLTESNGIVTDIRPEECLLLVVIVRLDRGEEKLRVTQYNL